MQNFTFGENESINSYNSNIGLVENKDDLNFSDTVQENKVTEMLLILTLLLHPDLRAA